ncbi:MAG: hypothetical protein JWN46_2874 [Acidimicrobiales bacterium]|nr:hypothetical protein [Acidimicrobiales bacterium]
MSYGIVLVFDGVTEDQYWAVNDKLGIERSGAGDWPEGLDVHVAGSSGSSWVVSELWTSKDAQEHFMTSRLGAALGAVGLPQPQVFEVDVVNAKVPG